MSNQTSLIIFDTEFTAWQGSAQRNWSLSWEHREIIQIAAAKVLISETGASVVSSFNSLVQPAINPKLSDYIIQLTGIEQQVIDNMGIDFHAALQQFYAFCEHGALACYSWGNDKSILMENCRLSGIPLPDFSAGFYNLHAMAKHKNIDGAHLCSGELATHLGLDLQGHMHNALYDVRSVALALDQWVTKGALSQALFLENKSIH